jgi:hypothetical protein
MSMTTTSMHQVVKVHVDEPVATEHGSYQSISFEMKDGSMHQVTAFFRRGDESAALPATEQVPA